MNYIGSKLSLLEFLEESINKVVKNNCRVFCDLFAGTGIVGNYFKKKGYKVIEMKLRQNSIFVDPENKGEFLLSRNLQDISRSHNASAVVVGTYAKGYQKVYVTARIVNPATSVILSSCDYELNFPDSREMAVLMQN